MFTHKLPSCLAMLAMVLVIAGPAPSRAQENRNGSPMATLVQVLEQTADAQFQLDILRGMHEALKGRRQVPMPKGWDRVEAKLGQSSQSEIKFLVQSLSLQFGSTNALAALQQTLADATGDLGARRSALEALLAVRDPELATILQQLLREPNLRGQALRAMAAYDDAQSPSAILAVYASLNVAERRDALATLSSRVSFAKPLLDAVGQGKVSPKDLTAEVIRQLRSLKHAELDKQIEQVYGVVRDSAEDKQREIEKYRAVYRAGGSQPGDAVRGRVVFARICAQCHTLFDAGGKIGPELTGANRNDLEYLLQNMVDPNAVIPNDYRTSTLETKDERVITGIVTRQDASVVAIATATETLTLPRAEIRAIHPSEISMMPEGLLANLTDQEVRDLIYYLNRAAQVPLLGTPETIDLFFNGKDLTNWEGHPDLWRVEEGEIVGWTVNGLAKNEFLKSQMVLGDFRLICQVRLTPNTENSGIQFRSEILAEGDVKGYQADIGAGWWGKLYEEHGRATLWDRSGEEHVQPGEWNTYEIVAVGDRILTALNGRPSVDLTDAPGAKQGVIAFQLHSGGPMEVRFRNFKLELNPSATLKTLRR